MNKIFSIFIFLIFLFNYVIKLNANDDTYINSNNIIYDEEKNIVELSKNSKININNTNILIDKGIIDYNNDKIEVFGNFYFYEELNILSGINLKGNLKLDIFSANDVSYIYNNDLKVDSKSLNRNSDKLIFLDSFITPCKIDGYFNCPTWSLRIDKTQYSIEKDKFTHYDTFLQIADYKLFYLPYFTHYGVKAPRKPGFLTPSLEFIIGEGQSLNIPYYIPFNDSIDLIFKPKISLDNNFEFFNTYDLKTIVNSRNAGGYTTFEMDNIKKANNPDINNTFRINTKNIISQNKVLSASGLFTNSISSTRSNNETPITFENIYLRLENYNFFNNNDYLKAELSSVKSFDSSSSKNIPVSPSINYLSSLKFKNSSIISELDFTILKRDESTSNNPSDAFKINLFQELIFNNKAKHFTNYNKIEFNNSYNEYFFNNNRDLNNEAFKSSLLLSSEFYFENNLNMKPRVKFIAPNQLKNTNKLVNEDSESISFNYQSQFSNNRFFGYDLLDNSPRIVFGLENELYFYNHEININVNQSYDFNDKNSYLDKINQKSKLSDYALEAKLKKENFLFQIDSRINQSNFSRKEMNYSVKLYEPVNITLNYHETKSDAFKSLSNNTQALNFALIEEINENISLSYSSQHDVKNNYDPYKSSFKISIFDECSKLDLTYSNIRYNDNFNTNPKETIGIQFFMDYLGFFGYEQTTDLFFSEPGVVDYGT